MKIKLTEEQENAFKTIWFIYGNGGRKHTMGNHKMIQGFLEHREDNRNFYIASNAQEKSEEWCVSEECRAVVSLILCGYIETALRISKKKPKNEN